MNKCVKLYGLKCTSSSNTQLSYSGPSFNMQLYIPDSKIRKIDSQQKGRR